MTKRSLIPWAAAVALTLAGTARADLVEDIGELGTATETSTATSTTPNANAKANGGKAPEAAPEKGAESATGKGAPAGKDTKKEAGATPTAKGGNATPGTTPGGKAAKGGEAEAGKASTAEAPAPKGKGEKGGAKEDRRKIPVYFTSEGDSTYTRDGILQIRDNVVVTQGDMRLQADQADVFMKPKDGAAAKGAKDESVDRVEMKGNVRVSKLAPVAAERVSARGDRAVFENGKRKVTLIGNARIHKGGHLIRGKQISYNVDTGIITVEKAEGMVQPDEAEADANVSAKETK